MKLKDVKDLKITMECGNVKVSAAMRGKELKEMMRFWKFASFMRALDGLIRLCKTNFLERMIK